MKKNPTYVFAGGGTGGHIYPAVAIAQELESRVKEAKIVFLGSHDRIEKKIVPQYGFEFYPIEMKSVKRSLSFSNGKALKLTYEAIKKCKTLLIDLDPEYVIGTGGYISLPALFASRNKYKILIHEQNVYPGLATKILAKYAKYICVSFEDTKRYLAKYDNLHVTGNPIRKSFKDYGKIESFDKYRIEQGKPTILVLGGSLGSSAINAAISHNIDRILEAGSQLIWQTGELDYDKLSSLYSTYNKVTIIKYIEDIHAAYSCSDLVVCRAGATTIAELAFLEKPTILIPYPYAAKDHQRKNSYMLEDAGAVKVVEERVLNEMISVEINQLIKSDAKRKQLSANIKLYARPEAAKDIVDLILK